jgi:protein ImuA
MRELLVKKDMIRALQREILSLQRHNKDTGQHIDMGLGFIEAAFPDRVFPIGAVHEFISLAAENAASTNAFISGLLSRLIRQNGICLWIANRRTIFPPALKLFGVDPDRVVFIDLVKQKDVLWAVEQALQCDALAAVVGELTELSFTESRRLQLATEQSHVTGFIHRYNPKSHNTVACVARWKIEPLPSRSGDDMPGLGFPRWNIQLLKVRNGKPGEWQVEWADGNFIHNRETVIALPAIQKLKAG